MIVRLDEDRDAAGHTIDRVDEHLAELVDQLLPGGAMADAFTNRNTRTWIIATSP